MVYYCLQSNLKEKSLPSSLGSLLVCLSSSTPLFSILLFSLPVFVCFCLSSIQCFICHVDGNRRARLHGHTQYTDLTWQFKGLTTGCRVLVSDENIKHLQNVNKQPYLMTMQQEFWEHQRLEVFLKYEVSDVRDGFHWTMMISKICSNLLCALHKITNNVNHKLSVCFI